MQAITSLETLCAFLNLDPTQRQRLINIPHFPLLLPMRLAQKIQKGTLDDPILKQFVPLDCEQETHPLFNADPVGDVLACQTPSLLKKYQARALLITSSACAMNCRFCFRRSFNYQRNENFSKELDQMRADTSLKEVILSGGDPLSLNNKRLQEIINQLDSINHLRRLRIHTRFPVAHPNRLNAGLISILQQMRLQGWFVIHINHPNELDDELLNSLKQLPCPILSQTVLLKGVNDNVNTLQQLFEQLVDHGIIPYYLHQLDKVKGAHHFEVSTERGLQLMEELQKVLSGYALPRFVQEIVNKPSKTVLF